MGLSVFMTKKKIRQRIFKKILKGKLKCCPQASWRMSPEQVAAHAERSGVRGAQQLFGHAVRVESQRAALRATRAAQHIESAGEGHLLQAGQPVRLLVFGSRPLEVDTLGGGVCSFGSSRRDVR